MNKKTLKLLKITTIVVFVALVIASFMDENPEMFLINGLISFVVTYVAYFGYPFIRTKFMHVKYDKKSCNKMAIWNSVIVGLLFCVLNGGGSVAIIYYLFNRTLWISDDEIYEDVVIDENVTEETNQIKNNEIIAEKKINNNKQEKNLVCPFCKSSNVYIKGNKMYCQSCDNAFVMKKKK